MSATAIAFYPCLCISTSRVCNHLARRKESMGLRGAAIRLCTLDTPCRKGSDLEVTNPASMSECPPRYLVFMGVPSDIMAGSVTSISEPLLHGVSKVQKLIAAPLNPMDSFLLARGLRTLNV